MPTLQENLAIAVMCVGRNDSKGDRHSPFGHRILTPKSVMGETTNGFRQQLDLTPGLSPGVQQHEAARLLPARIKTSALCLWRPTDEHPQVAEYLLIGVAVWSATDMQLLDRLNAAHADRAVMPVYVFDVDQLSATNDFDRIIPGIGAVHQTPVVGHWRDHVVVESATGFRGWELVGRVLNLPE